MPILYDRIEQLCAETGTSVTALCKQLQISRSALSELKSGRSKTLSASCTAAIAKHFQVSIDYLLGGTQQRCSAPSEALSNRQLKVALFGQWEGVSDSLLQEVLDFARFRWERAQKEESEDV